MKSTYMNLAGGAQRPWVINVRKFAFVFTCLISTPVLSYEPLFEDKDGARAYFQSVDSIVIAVKVTESMSSILLRRYLELDQGSEALASKMSNYRSSIRDVYVVTKRYKGDHMVGDLLSFDYNDYSSNITTIGDEVLLFFDASDVGSRELSDCGVVWEPSDGREKNFEYSRFSDLESLIDYVVEFRKSICIS